jgi:ATP phosphoribosyltransferase regulatory subunit
MKAELPVPSDVMKAIRAPFLDVGADLIDPPVIQPLNLLLDLTGETMRARLFVVQDEGGREACLRPDFTMAVARAHVQAGVREARYRYEGKAFRVSPKGAASAHAEEFMQVGLESFGGPATPEADGRMAALAWKAANAGGRGDLWLRLGDVALFAAFLQAVGVGEAQAAKLKRALAQPRAMQNELDRSQRADETAADPLAEKLAALPRLQAVAELEEVWTERELTPIGGRTPEEIVDRLARRAEAARVPRLTTKQVELIRAYLAIRAAPQIALAQIEALAKGPALTKALSDARARLAVLKADGAPLERVTFDAGFGRAFSYYDGFLFEITSAALDADAPVAAGGRYDALLARLSGSPGTAVGCIVRPARAWVGGVE